MSSSRQELLQEELKRREALQTELNNREGSSEQNSSNKQLEHLKELLGAGRTPFGNVRDFMYGMGKGASNIAKMVMPNAPNMPDIRQNNPSGLAQGFGQMLPALASGGASLPGQAAAAGIYGMTQAKQDEKNLFGLLPPGRINAGLMDALSVALGGRALQSVPKVINAGKSAFEYMRPGKASEEFRSTIGEGTAKENIQNLGQTAQFARQLVENEALIPKNELYQNEGSSNIYNVDQSNLPEGNINQFGKMINEGQNFGENKSKMLKNALREYRKSGNIDSFIEKGEDIFNVPELPENAKDKIEDVLRMPLKRESNYFSDPDVTSVYPKKGKLQKLHDSYKNKPTLNNYDELQSDLKKLRRQTESRARTSDAAAGKLIQIDENIKNLNYDKEQFMNTLPENMKNLENLFREKWRTNVVPYTENDVIEKLSKGKWDEVSSTDIHKTFTNMDESTKKVLHDLGPSATKNILYNALLKVKPGDAGGLAETILDLKRTKGYDQYIDENMERWSNEMLDRTNKVKFIKKALGTGSALGITGAVGGYVGSKYIK